MTRPTVNKALREEIGRLTSKVAALTREREELKEKHVRQSDTIRRLQTSSAYSSLILERDSALAKVAEKERVIADMNGCRNQMANAFNAGDATAFWDADDRMGKLPFTSVPELAISQARCHELEKKVAELEAQIQQQHDDHNRLVALHAEQDAEVRRPKP